MTMLEFIIRILVVGGGLWVLLMICVMHKEVRACVLTIIGKGRQVSCKECKSTLEQFSNRRGRPSPFNINHEDWCITGAHVRLQLIHKQDVVREMLN